MQVLRWLLEEHYKPPESAADDYGTGLYVAARHGRLDALEFLLPLSAASAPVIVHACQWAMWAGQAAAAVRLLQHVPPTVAPELRYDAARGGLLSVVQTLCSSDDQYLADPYLCYSAVSCGSFELVHWLREQHPPCPWPADVFVAGAKSGSIAMLDHLRSAGAPLGPEQLQFGAMATAAGEGHVEVLRWLRAQEPPYPWDSSVLRRARENRRITAVAWLVEAGCPDVEEPRGILRRLWGLR